MKSKCLSAQKIIITGASGRIGSEVVRKALNQGATVLMVDISNEKLIDAKEQLSINFPGQVFCYECNITDSGEVCKMIEFAKNQMNNVTSAVHCAYPISTSWGTQFEDLNSEIIDKHLSMQLGASILFSQLILKYFKQNGGGSLIHLSSIQGVSSPKFNHYEGTNMTSPIEYSAIKAGIISITKWLAKYYRNSSIRVNCVSPGGILSDQPQVFIDRYRQDCTNIGMLTSDQVSGMICFLLSDEAKAINGQNIIVDDGWSL